MNKALMTLGGLAVAGVVWKGRELRAQLTMTGEGWSNLHPKMQAAAAEVVRVANKRFRPLGLSVGIFEGWRSEARQRELMQTNATRVTDWRNSYHVWGLACDFVFIDRFGRWTWEPVKPQERTLLEQLGAAVADFVGWETDPNRALWRELGGIIEGAGLRWGGGFSGFFDGPHGQLELHSISQLKAAYSDPATFVSLSAYA